MYFFFFKQKTAYEMRISDWSSDVCSSDLLAVEFTRGISEIAVDDERHERRGQIVGDARLALRIFMDRQAHGHIEAGCHVVPQHCPRDQRISQDDHEGLGLTTHDSEPPTVIDHAEAHETAAALAPPERRSEEHTSELQSLMRISYAVFRLKKKTT